MATFRDSIPVADVHPPAASASDTEHQPHAPDDGDVRDRSIGDILADLRHLSAEQVDKALAYQREHGVRFGEAAVALGYASKSDVLFALAQQFHYPYAPGQPGEVSPELVTLTDPFSPRAEGFRALRSQLMMRLFDGSQPRHALAVLSPDAGDGKTYCAANLAVTLAQLGGSTLLVDADMRGPRLHEVFKVENTAGLSGILAGRGDRQVIQQIAHVPSLHVMPTGITPPNPLELVERPAFGLLIRELVSKFDHVIVDTPAARHGSDSAVIATRCGAALLVARKGKGRVAAMQQLMATLAGTPGVFTGAVVNEY